MGTVRVNSGFYAISPADDYITVNTALYGPVELYLPNIRDNFDNLQNAVITISDVGEYAGIVPFRIYGSNDTVNNQSFIEVSVSGATLKCSIANINEWAVSLTTANPNGGEKGDTGTQGPKGDTGTTGAQGDTGAGVQGDTGSAGQQGDTGTKGDTGAGIQGDTGTSGAKGDTGTTGAKGDTGTTGAKGDTGTTGAKGDTGTTGAKGDTGTIGAKGDTGTTGAKGDTGTSGAKGDTGTAGTKGDTGTTGAKGDTGSSGAKGDTGTSGSKGDTGADGQSSSVWQFLANTGATSGDPGFGYLLWNNATQISATQVNISITTDDGIDIDLFLALITVGTTIVIQDRALSDNFQTFRVTSATTPSSNYWQIPVSLTSSGGTGTTNFANNLPLIVAISVPGAKGDTGVTGAKGDTGTTGAKGDTGTTGAKGDTGTTGAKGDTGTSGAKGDTGTSGAKGDTGTTGAKGDTGTTGAKGDTGTSGAKGDTGTTGTKGDTGTTGAKGDTGNNGAKGDTGATGGGAAIAAGASTVNAGTVVFSNSNNINFGLSGSTMTASYPAPYMSDYLPWQMANSSNTSIGASSIFFCPILPPSNVTFNGIEIISSNNVTSGAVAALTRGMTLSYGLYSENGGTALSLIGSSSVQMNITMNSNVSFGLTFSNGNSSFSFSSATSSHSFFNIQKIVYLPFTSSMFGGSQYFWAQNMSTSSAGSNVALTLTQLFNVEFSNASLANWADSTAQGSNRSIIQEPYGFIRSATSNGLPNSVAYSDMSVYSNYQPYLFFKG